MTQPLEISASRRAAQAVRRSLQPAWDGVSVFMLPSDLPVSLSPHDIAVLHDTFARQPSNSLWCGFTLLGEVRDALNGEQARASRAILFTSGPRQPYFTMTRWLDGSYALCERDGSVLRHANDLAQLLSMFNVNRPAVH